ncbi:hypothetical protein FACS1894145_3980 [Bacteroidia bacterium]|nr:hypothetical protein FACS1894145_3980 [Bacteroidia bacterium]
MKRLFFYLILLLFPLTFVTCFNSEGDSIGTTDEIIIKTKPFDGYLHVELTDAKTGKSLRGTEVSIAVKGKDAEKVYNNLGIRENTYKTKVGFYDFMVDVANTTGDFVLSVSCEGYEDNIQHIRLNKSKFSTVQAKMLKKSDLPDGISVAAPVTFTTDTQGKTTTSVNISVDNNNTVLIPQGAVLKDAEGKVLSGEVKATVSFYDPAKTADFFPGGLDVEAVNARGQSENIAFMSAGLFDINLTAGNKEVKNIESNGFELTTIVDPQMVNPNTGNPIAEGDQIQLWSMDPETAIWKEEKTATVKKNSTGQLYLSETISHLSSWNWDWFTDYCTQGLTLQFRGNAKGDYITITNRSPINYYSNSTTIRVDVNDSYYNNLVFNYVPRNMNTILELKSSSPNVIIQPSTIVIPNLCEPRTYPVNVINIDPDYTVNINVDVRAKSNPNTKVVVSGWAYVYGYANNSTQSQYINNGQLSISAKAGGDYYFDVSLANSFGYGYFRIDDMSGNKLKLTYSPGYASYYINWFEYGTIDIPKKELIIDKPVDKIINLSTIYVLSDEDLRKISL